MNGTNPDLQPVIPQAKILVVDDNNLVAKTIGFKLRNSGFQVTTVLNGAEAMATVRKDKPDLILLDINFPDDFAAGPQDGFGILEWLHRMDESRRIPVIMITGSEDPKNEERARAVGAAALFRKPIKHEELVRAILSLLPSNVPAPA